MPELFQVIRLLQDVQLFRGLDRSQLAPVGRMARYYEVPGEAFFFTEGAPARTVYLLRHGRVKLLHRTPQGREVVLRFVGPGDLLGPTATLGDQHYPVSAQAIRQCQALAWEGQAMAQLMEACPRIALNALNDYAARVQELRDRYCELATERVEQRVAHVLLRLAHQAGWNTGNGVLIDMPLSRRDLAEMTGTTLYTVSRILAAWERRGLVEIGRQRVVVRQSVGLETIGADGAHRPAAGNGHDTTLRSSARPVGYRVRPSPRPSVG